MSQVSRRSEVGNHKRRSSTPGYLLALLRELAHVPRGLTENAEAKQVRKTNRTDILYQIGKMVRKSIFKLLIRLNRFFHLGKNRNGSNRFIAIYCDLLRFIANFCDFFLGNQIRNREKTEEVCKPLSLQWFPF